MSRKHLQRYVNKFSGRHDPCESETLDEMAMIAKQSVGKRLRY